ncbi:MAG TPA: hypothetical protein VNQ77_08505 [Frankiaceae bacterium]|nr:hypothetical protein [Frankiaceae bacterium]
MTRRTWRSSTGAVRSTPDAAIASIAAPSPAAASTADPTSVSVPSSTSATGGGSFLRRKPSLR